MSDNNGSEQSRIIKTQDENGQIHNFELIDIMELEGQEYGLLVYLDEENQAENEEQEEEVVVMKLNREDESYTFETIEDDKEFEKIVSFLETEAEEE